MARKGQTVKQDGKKIGKKRIVKNIISKSKDERKTGDRHMLRIEWSDFPKVRELEMGPKYPEYEHCLLVTSSHQIFYSYWRALFIKIHTSTDKQNKKPRPTNQTN